MDGCEEQDVLVHNMMLSNQWIPAPSWAQTRPPPPRSSRPQSHPQHERAARTQRTDKSFDLPKANLVLQMMTRAHLSTLADVRHLFFNDRSLTTGGADTNDHIEALRLMLPTGGLCKGRPRIRARSAPTATTATATWCRPAPAWALRQR